MRPDSLRRYNCPMIRALIAASLALQISLPARAQMQTGAAGSASAGTAASGAAGAAVGGV